ncbi:hypothetical protein P4C99_21660 [Pontiellaceae bacterium B1224]|nr:hypothetical protein [Pontiellaceae bacterium B1224]
MTKWSGDIDFGDWVLPPHPGWQGAIGGCNLDGTELFVTVRKSDLVVTSVLFKGTVEDLWDGNIKSTFWNINVNKDIVFMQVGYDTLGDAGRTFKHKYTFEGTFNPLLQYN